MKRIGILGGTFNPPHLGHLIIAEYVRVELQLDKVWFIPTYHPPHKQKTQINAKQRVAMLEKAISNHPPFKINQMEIERLGQSYTIDTMKALTEIYPTYDFYFMIGGDMVAYLPQWKEIDLLIDYVHFVGINRTGYSLASEYPIIKVDAPLIDISSTMIRNRLSQGKSIKYLVPDAVNSYIKEYRLYE